MTCSRVMQHGGGGLGLELGGSGPSPAAVLVTVRSAWLWVPAHQKLTKKLLESRGGVVRALCVTVS